MRFKKVQKRNPLEPDEPRKFYATPANLGTITLTDLANRISRSSSLTRGDVLNVLSNFLDEIPGYLKDGKSVQLGEFGTLRLSFSSKGVDTIDEVTAHLVTKTRVLFTPSTSFKNDLRLIRYEEHV